MIKYTVIISRLKAWVTTDAVLPFAVAAIVSIWLFWPMAKGQLPIATDILSGAYKPWVNVKIPEAPFPFPVKNMESFDTVRQNYNFKHQAIQQIKRGLLPLWNPTQLSGTPLAANFITGTYYPFNFFFFILPFAWAWATLGILQVFLAIVTMYYFLRSEAVSKLSASFGGILFSLCGFMAGFFHAISINHAFLWTPLGLLAITKFSDKRDPRWLLLLSACIGLIGLASHVQLLLYSIFLFAGYIVYKGRSEWRLTSFLLQFGAIGLGLGLCAIQLFPTIELIEQSSRLGNFSGRVDDYFSPFYHLLLFLSPNYFGNPGRLNYFGGPSFYHEYSFYLSIAPLFLTAIGFMSFRKKGWFWLIVLVISLVSVIDSPIARLPQTLNLPLLGSITVTKGYAYTDLAIIILAAFGLDAVRRQITKPMIYAASLIALGATVGLILILLNAKFHGSLFYSLRLADPQFATIAFKNTLIAIGIFGSIALLFGVLFFIKNRTIQLGIFLLICGITIYDLQRQFFMQNGFTPVAGVFPQTKITRYLASFALPARIISIEDSVVPPDVGGYYGFEHIDGYESHHSRLYAKAFATYESKFLNEEPNYGRMISTIESRSPVTDQLAVDYILSPYPLEGIYHEDHTHKVMEEGGVYVYQNPNTVPRFYLTSENLGLVSDFTLLQTGAIDFYSQEGHVVGTIAVQSYQPGNIKLAVTSDKNQQLQTMIINYPGWHVLMNGRKVSAKTNQEGFLAAPISPGKQTIIFRYLPTSFLLGAGISLVSILACVGFLFWLRKRPL